MYRISLLEVYDYVTSVDIIFICILRTIGSVYQYVLLIFYREHIDVRKYWDHKVVLSEFDKPGHTVVSQDFLWFSEHAS